MSSHKIVVIQVSVSAMTQRKHLSNIFIEEELKNLQFIPFWNILPLTGKIHDCFIRIDDVAYQIGAFIGILTHFNSPIRQIVTYGLMIVTGSYSALTFDVNYS